MAKVSNIYIDQGSDYYSTIEYKVANNTPIDITGYAPEATIRKYANSTTAFNIPASVDSIESGKVNLFMPALETQAIPDGRYFYDVIITSPTGQITRIAEGTAVVTPGMTKIQVAEE